MDWAIDMSQQKNEEHAGWIWMAMMPDLGTLIRILSDSHNTHQPNTLESFLSFWKIDMVQ